MTSPDAPASTQSSSTQDAMTDEVMPELSCVMVSFYTGEVLFEAIDSVLRQTAPVSSLVVVDNGNPAEAMQRLDQLANDEPRLVIVRGQGNVGFAAGSNLGARAREAGLYLFLNPDCTLPEDALQRLWEEYRQLRERSLLAPLLINEDFTEQRGSRRAVLTPWRAVVEWLGLYRLAPSHPYFLRFNQTNDPLPLDTHKVDVTSGAAMYMARTLFEELRGFDEGYFLHVEDIDLCVTLLKRGGATYVAPAIRVVHQGASSTSSPLRVEWHKARGFCRYFRKHFSGVYPFGFLTVVNALVWVRLVLRAPVLVLRNKSKRRHRATSDGAGGPLPTDARD